MQTASASSVQTGRFHPALRARQETTLPGAVRTLLAGETLCAEGDAADCAFEVMSGMLRVYRLLPDGRRQITGFLAAGRLVGIPADGVCLASIEAATPVTVRCYRRAAVESRLDSDPAFVRRLLAAAGLDLRLAQDQALLLGRKSATEKVASFLLQMLALQGDGAALSLPVRRGDIADYLGLTVETVSRCFTRLKTCGVIGLPTPTEVVVRDRERLEVCAEGADD